MKAAGEGIFASGNIYDEDDDVKATGDGMSFQSDDSAAYSSTSRTGFFTYDAQKEEKVTEDKFSGEYTESLHYKPKTKVSSDTIDALLAEINS